MHVIVNGESKEYDAPMAVSALLSAIGLEARKIAVERNREIVPKSAYDETIICDGDKIEIVQFVGGG